MPNLTVAASQGRLLGTYTQNLLELISKAGIPIEILAQTANVDLAHINPVPEFVSVSDYCRLMEAGAALTQDPLFGFHVGYSVLAASYGTYGIILLTAKTLGEALKQVVRYEGLMHNMGKTQLCVDGEDLEISWLSPWPEVNNCFHVGESIVASFLGIGEALSRQTFPVKEVGLMRPMPDNVELFRQQLPFPVVFGQARHYGCANAEILSWPLPFAIKDMSPMLISHAEQLLAERQKSGEATALENAVKNAIIEQLGFGNSGIAEIAAALHISARTLQRRLREINVPFRVLLDGTKRELAQRYLRTTSLSLTEIAFLVGYQEQSSFNHAFREWTGTTPSLWRAANASPPLFHLTQQTRK